MVVVYRRKAKDLVCTLSLCNEDIGKMKTYLKEE